jgi:hypothetical protein
MRRIEVLYFKGCPNGEQAVRLAHRVASEEGSDIDVVETLVTEADVEVHRFLGSPSIRVDGRDVDPAANQDVGYHYGCRIYETRSGRVGLPVDEWIRSALREARGPRPWLALGRSCHRSLSTTLRHG